MTKKNVKNGETNKNSQSNCKQNENLHDTVENTDV